MEYSDNTVLKNLKSRYEQFTNVEKTIANFFINNKETQNYHQNQYQKNYLYLKLLYQGLQRSVDIKVLENLYLNMKRTLVNTIKKKYQI